MLSDERTAAALALAASEPAIRQHLAIVRLAKTMSLDEVYDIVLDSAAAAALAAVDTGDMSQIAEIWHAAPRLTGEPFIGGYVTAVLLAVEGRTDDARKIMGRAVNQGGPATRFASAERPSRLCRYQPTHTDALAGLASLLTASPTADADPGGQTTTDAC